MSANNESCSNCFFVVSKTTRLPSAISHGRASTIQLTCHYDTPSGTPATTALWAPVDPDDWCGAWSSNGLPRYRTDSPSPSWDQPASVTFNISSDLLVATSSYQVASVRYNCDSSFIAHAADDWQVAVEFDGASDLVINPDVP